MAQNSRVTHWGLKPFGAGAGQPGRDLAGLDITQGFLWITQIQLFFLGDLIVQQGPGAACLLWTDAYILWGQRNS